MKLFRRAPPSPPVPFDGYTDGRTAMPLVEALPDMELRALNALLPWRAFLVDGRGRRFGAPASPSKRNAPETIPDRRIVMLHERLDLSEKTVLEVGCFEGLHTIALAQRAKAVLACDARIENVAKTLVRCSLFGLFPSVFVWNVEEAPPPGIDPACDVLHHVGVLYHLADPVAHLSAIAPRVRQGIMLDTHYALPEQADAEYEAQARSWRCRSFSEGGRADAFSGMYSTARWLLLDDLTGLLRVLGFAQVELVEDRRERNGARALILAQR
jgi:2-polyprenyl-3-methyl-5-hydroxy-6-metoxy-1,4-benzoquinol methylase